MSNNIIDSLNKAAEEVIGRTVAGKLKKGCLPQPIREAYMKWRECEKDLAQSIQELPPKTRNSSREKDIHEMKSDKQIQEKLSSLKKSKR